MLPAMGNFRSWEWILILLLALLLFGGFKKLPDAARGVGRSLRIFKAETKGLADDDTDAPAKPADESAVKASEDDAPKAGEDAAAAPVEAKNPSTSA
jgi:sec-independent protein translocase protein TatA